MNRKQIKALLTSAVLAPSGDNMQPWRFLIRDGALDLYVTCGHDLHVFESGYRSLYYSAGAVIENLRVASHESGHDIAVRYLPDKSQPLLAASIRFFQSEHPHSRYAEVLEKRCTNRRMYRAGQKIDSEIYLHLSELLEDYEGFQLLWSRKSDRAYSELSKILGEADQMRFENKLIHNEFAATLRCTPEEAERSSDGLDVRGFESGPGAGKVFKTLSDWKKLQQLNRIGASRLFNLYARMQIASSQACGLLVAEDFSAESYLKGGELMQRIWHEMTLRDLSLQPMESLPIFMMNRQLGNASVFSEDQLRVLDRIGDAFCRLYGVRQDQGFIFLFRTGYASPPTVRSKRRPVDSFIVDQPVMQKMGEAAA